MISSDIKFRIKGLIVLIKITRTQKDEMVKAGILRDKKTKNGLTVEEANYVVANREHCGRDKTYYVVEEYRVKKFLGLIKDKPRNQKFKPNKGGGKHNDRQGFSKKTF